MKDPKSLIGGFVAGAALGIAAGILLAPDSGKSTRKKIVDGSLKMKDDLMNTVDVSLDNIRKQFNSRIDQLARSGKSTIDETSEKVKV
ncbi:YtxH domain-containing protein [Chryseolinea lacunae]|uniref:YtxH domain-containing protein n=1 Tax=Chryseolinea lacunae TaxID=2801331 RepID=A0ABS1L0A4_9BACT|nr:YtxH domain-containing protein [Chryseolinea lacunae]MBL0745120.1 YtxH domain-containing protein [Chryseolinea lacunae]